MGYPRAFHYAAAIALAFPVGAAGQGFVASGATTEILIDTCSTHEGSKFDPCAAYVLGALDALSFASLVCPPTGFTTAQAVAVVKNYMTANPALWNRHPSALVKSALRNAWSCSKK
jgi:hypothetical protein